MKLIIAIVLVTTFGLACKKESELTKFNDSIQGSWVVQSNKLEYYSNDNAKLQEDVVTGEGTFKEISFLQNLTASFKVHDDAIINSQYNIINNDGKKFIEFNNIAVFDTQFFEVILSSNTSMTWKVKFTNIEYQTKTTGESLTAPYAILTLQLIKK